MSQAENVAAEPVPWTPFREKLWVTLLRTGLIAAAIGFVFAWRSHHFSVWPLASLLAFWPAFGGHWVEVFFLNVMRPRLPWVRGVQILSRLLLWFVAGILLALAMQATAVFMGVPMVRSLSWLSAGLGFIAIELMVHLAMQFGGRPNFYDRRG